MQNNIFSISSYFIFKILILGLFSYGFSSLYLEYSSYDYPIYINFSNYKISTYTGFFILIILFLIAVILLFFNLILKIVNFFLFVFSSSHSEKRKDAINKLIESSLLQILGEKIASKNNLDSIRSKYLTDDEIHYLEFLRNRNDFNELPTDIFYKLQKFKAFKIPVSKQIAKIEYNTGNFEIAYDYAIKYKSINEYEKEINILICKILLRKNKISELEYILKKISNIANNNNENYSEFSDIYLELAEYMALNDDQQKALEYCKAGLILNPLNYSIIDFICRIWASEKESDIIEEILLSCFSKKPNFNIFLKLYKYSSYDKCELYDIISPFISESRYFELRLAIASYLKLFQEVENILKLPD